VKKVFGIIAILVVIGAVASAGGSTSASDSSDTGARSGLSTNNDNPPTADVTITKCAEGAYGLADLQVEITNNSSKRSNYTVSLNLEDSSGRKVGEATAISNNVDAGQVALEDAFGTGEGFATCKIKEVNRFAA
jgi:hypothetical protein